MDVGEAWATRASATVVKVSVVPAPTVDEAVGVPVCEGVIVTVAVAAVPVTVGVTVGVDTAPVVV